MRAAGIQVFFWVPATVVYILTPARDRTTTFYMAIPITWGSGHWQCKGSNFFLIIVLTPWVLVQVWFPGSDPSHPALQTSNLPAELTLPWLTVNLEFKHCEKQNVKISWARQILLIVLYTVKTCLVWVYVLKKILLKWSEQTCKEVITIRHLCTKNYYSMLQTEFRVERGAKGHYSYFSLAWFFKACLFSCKQHLTRMLYSGLYFHNRETWHVFTRVTNLNFLLTLNTQSRYKL